MDDLLAQVQGVFAEVTRYPLEVLSPDADLEEDLGIDSVKRAEIMTVFGTRYGLPKELDFSPDDVRTIGTIAALLGRHVTPSGGADPGTVAPPPANGTAVAAQAGSGTALPQVNGRAHAAPAARLDDGLVVTPAQERPTPSNGAGRARADVQGVVIAVMADVMRYPHDILVEAAALEDDLGISAVRLGEILAALRERLHLGDLPPAASLRTVGDMVTAVHALSRSNGAGAEHSRAARAATIPDSARTEASAQRALLVGRPFEGKVALVTGSGHGIGRAIALQLGELGATVVVNSFHSRDRGEQTTRDIVAAGSEAHHVWGSVAKGDQLRQLFGEIDRRFGRLDFFVSNASNGMIAPLAHVTEEHWDRAFRTNVMSLHQGALLAAPLMRPRGGRIIALSSPGAHRYIEHFGCMGPIKAAVESLTRYLAIELAPDNIQVNAVSAGPIYGELLEKYPDKDRLIPYWESLSAGKRLGQEADVANFVMYLLSDMASKITGSVMLVDSGGSQRI